VTSSVLSVKPESVVRLLIRLIFLCWPASSKKKRLHYIE